MDRAEIPYSVVLSYGEKPFIRYGGCGGWPTTAPAWAAVLPVAGSLTRSGATTDLASEPPTLLPPSQACLPPATLLLCSTSTCSFLLSYRPPRSASFLPSASSRLPKAVALLAAGQESQPPSFVHPRLPGYRVQAPSGLVVTRETPVCSALDGRVI